MIAAQAMAALAVLEAVFGPLVLPAIAGGLAGIGLVAAWRTRGAAR